MNKRFSLMQNVGAVKYLVNHHDGTKKHADGSDFFDITTFSNKRKFNGFVRTLRKSGYTESK